MNRRAHTIPIYLLLYVLLTSIPLFSSCEKEETYHPNTNFDKKPVQTLQNITSFRSDKGKVYAKLVSPIVQYYVGDSVRTVFPKGIKITFFNEDLTDKSFLTSRYAINYTNNKNIVYLRDSIKIINYNSADTTYCKDLYWDRDKRIVYTHRPVRRYSRLGQSFGEGMISNEKFDSVTILKPSGTEIIEEKSDNLDN